MFNKPIRSDKTNHENCDLRRLLRLALIRRGIDVDGLVNEHDCDDAGRLLSSQSSSLSVQLMRCFYLQGRCICSPTNANQLRKRCASANLFRCDKTGAPEKEDSKRLSLFCHVASERRWKNS